MTPARRPDSSESLWLRSEAVAVSSLRQLPGAQPANSRGNCSPAGIDITPGALGPHISPGRHSNPLDDGQAQSWPTTPEFHRPGGAQANLPDTGRFIEDPLVILGIGSVVGHSDLDTTVTPTRRESMPAAVRNQDLTAAGRVFGGVHGEIAEVVSCWDALSGSIESLSKIRDRPGANHYTRTPRPRHTEAELRIPDDGRGTCHPDHSPRARAARLILQRPTSRVFRIGLREFP